MTEEEKVPTASIVNVDTDGGEEGDRHASFASPPKAMVRREEDDKELDFNYSMSNTDIEYKLVEGSNEY